MDSKPSLLNGLHTDIEQLATRLERLERDGVEVVRELQYLNRTMTSMLAEVTATRVVLKEQMEPLIVRASGIVPGGVMPVKWVFVIIAFILFSTSPHIGEKLEKLIRFQTGGE